ncbi:unnamed protein product [Pedinophyceae sp. YPF-701]|nr:unnamed protein product [Pedinophyceae sp. YPF-701]
MPTVLLRTAAVTLTGAEPTPLDVDSPTTVADLSSAASAATGIPLERLRLVHKGCALTDLPATEKVELAENASIVAVAAPARPRDRAPPGPAAASATAAARRVWPHRGGAGARARESDSEDDHDADLRFQMSPNSPWLDRKLAAWLQQQGVSDLALTWIFFVRLWVWGVAAAWLFLLPYVNRYGHAAPYVLCTIIVVIYTNLGRRQSGEASAYTIFNGFQALPGQMGAGDVDNAIMRRH